MLFEPVYIPQALNTGICIQVTNLCCGPTQKPVLATASTGKKIRRGFGKNAGEWTGKVEISKEEISDSKRSMYGYILTYSRL